MNDPPEVNNLAAVIVAATRWRPANTDRGFSTGRKGPKRSLLTEPLISKAEQEKKAQVHKQSWSLSMEKHGLQLNMQIYAGGFRIYRSDSNMS